MSKKDTDKTMYSTKKDLQAALKEYISKPKKRRTLKKSILNTLENNGKLFNGVAKVIPCNWFEVIRDDSKRITERNKQHDKKAVSIVME